MACIVIKLWVAIKKVNTYFDDHFIMEIGMYLRKAHHQRLEEPATFPTGVCLELELFSDK